EASSTPSLPRPMYSWARVWASFTVSRARRARSAPCSWARFAQSVPFSRSSSRVSSPTFGARTRARPAPMRAPTVRSPRAPRKSRSSRSSTMMHSFRSPPEVLVSARLGVVHRLPRAPCEIGTLLLGTLRPARPLLPEQLPSLLAHLRREDQGEAGADERPDGQEPQGAQEVEIVPLVNHDALLPIVSSTGSPEPPEEHVGSLAESLSDADHLADRTHAPEDAREAGQPRQHLLAAKGQPLD